MRTRFIEHVDRLVGSRAIGHEAVRQTIPPERVVRNRHGMDGRSSRGRRATRTSHVWIAASSSIVTAEKRRSSAGSVLIHWRILRRLSRR